MKIYEIILKSKKHREREILFKVEAETVDDAKDKVTEFLVYKKYYKINRIRELEPEK
jgi:hypothetical protein